MVLPTPESLCSSQKSVPWRAGTQAPRVQNHSQAPHIRWLAITEKVLTEWESLWFLYSAQHQEIEVSGLRSLLQPTPSAGSTAQQAPASGTGFGRLICPAATTQETVNHVSSTHILRDRSNIYSVSITWRSFQDPDALDFARKVSGGWEGVLLTLVSGLPEKTTLIIFTSIRSSASSSLESLETRRQWVDLLKALKEKGYVNQESCGWQNNTLALGPFCIKDTGQ